MLSFCTNTKKNAHGRYKVDLHDTNTQNDKTHKDLNLMHSMACFKRQQKIMFCIYQENS